MFFRRRSKNFDEKNVVEGCQKGINSSQKHLFEQFYGFVKKICLRYSSNLDETEEMINDVFLKIFLNIKNFEFGNNDSLAAWIKTLAIRACIDYYRKYKSKTIFLDIETNHYNISTDENVIDSMHAEEIISLMHQLPPQYRMVFSLYVIDGYSHEEIAKELGISEVTSRSNLSRAREKMQCFLKQNEKELNLSKGHVIRQEN